MAIDTLK